jgi:membrane-associated protease RseP (regulator of RpoE activity)
VDLLGVFLLVLLILYAIVAWFIRKKRVREDVIIFYGPVMALKTRKVGFFDRFKPFAPLLRVYGSAGIAMVAIVSVLMTAIVFFAFHREVVEPPQPVGIFYLPNVLAIPGVNQFIPFTLPVILAIAVTVAIHEIGHGILCRVEGITVKSIGVLLLPLFIPLGFFVEPDEEELERTPPIPKSRMFGAGITNNIVASIACFGFMILLLGMLVPVPGPIIYKVVEGSPAHNASVPLGSVILDLGGEKVASAADVSGILEKTRPGDTITMTVLPADVVRDLPAGGMSPEGARYTLNLTSLPGRTYGYMGIFYYQPDVVPGVVRNLASPLGLIFLSILPVDVLSTYNQFPQLHLIFMDSPDAAFYRVPFPLFWGVIHLLFWSGWFNIMVGTFNALPMVPFDGGFIMKEGVEGLTKRIGRPQLADRIVLATSLLILVLLILILAIPYIAKGLTMFFPVP